ncbi:nucleotidyltransferase family protein [Prosthecobacter sp.]|uniref:nucleotidyltransferase family protein n=1 Tax=Prosthecobacter sp. TaxID=1965333 RepID=UPI001D960554|nr:nucleotidyltransferase family protein [Prosthecobacter sp.]MCB1276167.1 nucleotidyltransferase family protein [Prosthecobacter sp.]
MPMVTPQTQSVLGSLRALLPGLRQEFPLHGMALFGSTARGEAGPQSDVDILVDVDGSIGLEFVTLAERLEAALGRKVDLVSRRALKPALKQIIEQEAIDVEA